MKKSEKKPTSPNLEVTCRFVEKADIRGLARVHAEAFGGELKGAMITAREHAGTSTDKGAVVALSGKKIIGYAMFEVQDSDMYIAYVGVSKNSRGQGVCGVMMPWLLRRLACYNCDTASLLVVSDTDAAVRCYKSHGFKGSGSSLTYKPARKRPCPKTNAATYICADGSCH